MHESPPTPLSQWIGSTQYCEEVPGLFPLRAMAALLDYRRLEFADNAYVPPLWHWLYFLPTPARHELAEDGHARRGGFLPPVSLPRRMWAGGRLQFLRPLHTGVPLQRQSTIRKVEEKSGRSGPLVFVEVEHQIRDQAGPLLIERQDIVYRGATTGTLTAPPAPAETAQFSHRFSADAALLFRYSAVTFNSHRIHYDLDYATRREGYPGLVVHGPLLATLLMELLLQHHPGAAVHDFSFRALHPVFADSEFCLCGRLDLAQARLWIVNGQGGLCMEARAGLSAQPD